MMQYIGNILSDDMLPVFVEYEETSNGMFNLIFEHEGDYLLSDAAVLGAIITGDGFIKLKTNEARLYYADGSVEFDRYESSTWSWS